MLTPKVISPFEIRQPQSVIFFMLDKADAF